MKEFKYKAVNDKGEVQQGTMVASDEQQVLAYLYQSQLVPLRVETNYKNVLQILIASVTEKINTDDKIYLYRSLTMLLKSGADLYQAIEVIASDIPKSTIRNFLYALRFNLEQGKPLWEVFDTYKMYFTEIEINIIRSGEEGGKLVANLDRLAQDLEKERIFSQKLVSALIYPIILLGATGTIVTGVVVFLIPRIAGLFSEINIKVPLFTQVVLSLGLFLNKYIFFFIGFGALMSVLLYIFLFRTNTGKKVMAVLVVRTPFINHVVEYKSLRDFCLGTSFLVDAGIPLLRTLTIVAGVVTFPKYRKALAEIIETSLPKGVSLSEGLKQSGVFPRNLVHLVSISEKTGMLAENLKNLSDFYGFELEQFLTRVSTLIEPLILIFTGGIIGSILISIIVPIYQLVTSF